VAERVRQRWNRHAAETLADAAEASGERVEDLLLKAVSDDRRHELLARALGVAQDTALRDKRRALGRALAAGIAGDDARVDDELLFVRAVADLDEPHIRLLALLSSKHALAGEMSGSMFQGGWSPGGIAARDPGLGETLQTLLRTLDAHGLIQVEASSSPWQSSRVTYNITLTGLALLERLACDVPDSIEPELPASPAGETAPRGDALWQAVKPRLRCTRWRAKLSARWPLTKTSLL
jgi:hypothetical protein